MVAAIADLDSSTRETVPDSPVTEVARALLSGIDEDAVDFRPTYDGEESEPVVSPGAFPISGKPRGRHRSRHGNFDPAAQCRRDFVAAIHMIENPQATTADLLRHMPGPDFPTGGVLVEDKSAILAAYETGRGGFRVRARWTVEKGKHATWQVVVTEIPYQVQKARLIEQTAQLLEERKLPLLGDVRDESAETVRFVENLRRAAWNLKC